MPAKVRFSVENAKFILLFNEIFIPSQPKRNDFSNFFVMKFQQHTALLIAFSMLSLVACKRDVFDPDAYVEVINESFPVNNIDQGHTWNLTQSHSTVVTANPASVSDVQYVRILSGNPYREANVEILAEKAVAKGGTATLFYYAPQYQTQFFAAAVTASGQYVVKAFTASQESVTFDNIDDSANQGSFNEPIYQTYTYCFEEDYPKPGDWDFNDCVLRIQKLPAAQPNEIRLRVSLAAVGAKKQIAAAIRLLDYVASDVSNVYIEEGRTFDGAFEENQKRQFIESGALLLNGLNNEAVLNLFEDAHYALSPRLISPDKGGTTLRMFYNTSRNPDGSKHAQIAPKTLTYVVQLSNPRLIENFTLERIDPFILEDFNSGKWEVHTFSYKASQVLRDLGSNETATSNMMTWALKIPSATFRYPIEGQPLGFYKDGVLTGAYMENNHSYGQWVANHNSCLDWFRYPATGLVY